MSYPHFAGILQELLLHLLRSSTCTGSTTSYAPRELLSAGPAAVQ
jgi:hypothetical protein